MMGAVARAARAGGARTVGVIPRALLDKEVGDRAADELVVVDDMRTRKGLMDERSDAFLALPGGLGTLEELFEVWVARSLGMHAKPVVALDVDGLYAPLRAQVDLLAERGFVRRPALGALQWADTVAEALDLVEAGLAAPVTMHAAGRGGPRGRAVARANRSRRPGQPAGSSSDLPVVRRPGEVLVRARGLVQAVALADAHASWPAATCAKTAAERASSSSRSAA